MPQLGQSVETLPLRKNVRGIGLGRGGNNVLFSHQERCERHLDGELGLARRRHADCCVVELFRKLVRASLATSRLLVVQGKTALKIEVTVEMTIGYLTANENLAMDYGNELISDQ